jgi:hypothetical protein
MQFGVTNMDASNVWVKGGTSGLAQFINTGGAGQQLLYGSTWYYRLRMWRLNANYVQSWTLRGAGTNSQIDTHNFGTKDVFVQPALSITNSLNTPGSTQWCSFGSSVDVEGWKICDLDNGSMHSVGRTRMQCLYNKNQNLYNSGNVYVSNRMWL